MAGITLIQAQQTLSELLAAHSAVLLGQSYEVQAGSGRRSLTRADLDSIQTGIDFWDKKVKALTAEQSSRGSRRATMIPWA
jgi:hypothetical protein